MPRPAHSPRVTTRIARSRRARGRRALLAALAVGLVCLSPPPLAADEDSVFGEWRSTRSDGGGAVIERAVMEDTESMPPLRRRIARRRLLETNPPIPRLCLSRDGSSVTVRFGSSHAYTAPLGGRWQMNRSADGNEVEVSHRLRGDRLIERTRTSSGTSANVFSLESSGRLRMRMTIESPHLPIPIRYALSFVPASAP